MLYRSIDFGMQQFLCGFGGNSFVARSSSIDVTAVDEEAGSHREAIVRIGVCGIAAGDCLPCNRKNHLFTFG